MSNLIELLAILGTSLPIMGGKVKQLIEGIQKKKFKTREDVIKSLFKNAADSIQSYNKLKLKAEKLLTFHLLTTKLGKTPILETLNECYAGQAKAMILIRQGYKKTGISIARRTFNMACQYELIHIALNMAELLARHYAEVYPQRRLWRRYTKATQKYIQLATDNAKVTQFYTDIFININYKNTYTKGIVKKLNYYTSEIDNISNPTAATKFYGSVLKIIQSYANKDFERAALTATKTLRFLESKPHVFKSHKAALLSYLSIAAIASKQHQLADKSLLKAIDLTGHAPYNWQVLTYYRAINALHARDYRLAFDLHRLAHKRRPSGFIAEQWVLLRAYLFLFSQAGLLHVKYARFGIGKFLNQTHRSAQDKAGSNINIIVAELLVYLYQDRARFIDRIDAVRTYAYRHLKGEDTARARFFLRVLFRLTGCDFQLERVHKATAHHRRLLHERDLNAKHNLEIEIVPFEHLLEVLDASLDKAPERRRASWRS